MILRKLLMAVGLLVVSVTIIGCSDDGTGVREDQSSYTKWEDPVLEKEVEKDVNSTKSLPNGFSLVSSGYVSGNADISIRHNTGAMVNTIRHDETGCDFVVMLGDGRENTSSSIVQIFVEKDGISVPYCESK